MLSADIPFILVSQSSEPIRLEVCVTPSDEVLHLRNKVKELEMSLLSEQKQRKSIEYKYSCEVTLLTQILDYCREYNFKLPARFFTRPYGD